MFTHEKFEAYKIAIEFTEIAFQIMNDLPVGYASLRDQLQRAALSVSLNIAEGTGKNRSLDRKRYYIIARGSAMECAAICDIVALIDRQLTQRTQIGKAKLRSVVNILSKACEVG